MKKSRLLFILPLLASFVLTSCDLLNNLNFGGPRRRSSKEEESQLVDDKSRHEHHWGDWSLTKEATCTVNGEESRECQICGQVETRIVSRIGHLWGDWMETIAATCTDSGLKERRCTRCDYVEQKYPPALGHIFDEGQWFTITEPTCYMNGIQENRCQRCGEITQREIPALEHNWSYSSGTIEPTCTTDGYYIRRCTVCGQQEEEVAPAIGHDLEIIGSDAMPEAGKAQVRLYKCVRCDVCFLGFNVNDVSNASKEHLVFETDYNGETSARFWGRPIGNALALSYDGVSVNQQSDECVYCSTETGDYFEYVFDLTEEQAALLSNCRLYCDAKPASYLNGTDFWAYGGSNTDWTPGYYIDGGDERFETNEDGSFVMVNDHARAGRDGQQGVELDTKVKLGKRIEGYRYVLYVDGNVVDFDSDTACPTHGINTNMQREEFELPYTFNLHQGENRISLHMAGGYRSTFYNFIFKPIEEEQQQQLPESSWILDQSMPGPNEGEALVRRYTDYLVEGKVKYEIDVYTANMQLIDGGNWKTAPETGAFKIGNNQGAAYFEFSIPRSFTGKMYQTAYIDSYSANKTKNAFIYNDQINLDISVNGSLLDLYPLTSLTFQQIFNDEVDGSNSVLKDVYLSDVNLGTHNSIIYRRLSSYNMTVSRFVFIGNE